MYETTTEIPFTATGADNRLKLHEAVRLMVDCCQFQEHHEESLRAFLRANGIAIFLFSLQLDILRWPEQREKVATAVKIYGCKSIYGLRRLTIRDEAGRLCIVANATGAFFDVAQGKAVKLDPAAFGLAYDEAEPMECLPRKIPLPADGGVPCPPFLATPSALDPNGHLASAMYFAIAGDALPQGTPFDRVRMEFKRQVKPGQSVIPVRFDAPGGKTTVDLRDADGVSFAAAEFSLVPQSP
jgi:acyl-ACP thioesterase